MNDKYRLKNILRFSICVSIPLLSSFFVITSCSDEMEDAAWYGVAVEKNNVLIEGYPVVFDRLIKRDGAELYQFVHNEDPYVRSYVLKAMFHSAVEINRELIEILRELDHEDAWMMLGYHEVGDSLLDVVKEWWKEGSVNRSFVCNPLGQLGETDTLEMLLEHRDFLISDHNCALAAGRIISNHPVSDELKTRVARVVFETEETDIQLRLLYGFYRNEENRPEAGSPAYRLIGERWVNTGPDTDPLLDQYVVSILGGHAFRLIIDKRGELLDRYPNLSVELAKNLLRAEWTENDARLLLTHPSFHVVSETIREIHSMDEVPENLINLIKTEILERRQDGRLFAVAMNLLLQSGETVEGYLSQLEQYVDENPFLTELSLNIYAEIENPSEYLDRIESLIGEGDIRSFYTMRVLVGDAVDSEPGDEEAGKLYQLYWKGIESGFAPVLQAGVPLITSEIFVNDTDLQRLTDAVQQHSFSENFRLYTLVAAALYERFGLAAEPFAMKIAENGFHSVNEELREAGWEIPGSMDRIPGLFRKPDWQSLYDMGTRPVWVLETDAGQIKVALDPLGAPATVSSIDSLTRSGSYNDTPIHRVVPNFVIQGGDVSGGTGIGGPGYLVPIEPSSKTFGRGMAGIASLGPDTEGSQFFFMKQWSPHLDGRYTIFGEVVEGMDIVDRIRVGDRVRRSYIVLDSENRP